MNATENPTNALVVEHIALVGYHVNAMLGRVPAYVSRADLVSAGHLALVRAARAYDESTGVPFARYAALRIKGALIDELRGMDWASRGARRRARQLTEVSDQLTATLGRAPSREELAEAMGMPVEEIDAAKTDAETRVLSMDGFDGSIAETVVSTAMSPEESLLADEKLQYLRAGINSLPERLQYVVTELFFHDRPVADLADELGVTQSRISQLRTEALGLLKDGINASLDPELVPAAARPDGVAERRRKAYFAEVAARAATSSQASTVTFVPTQRGAEHETYAAPQLHSAVG
ncbi:sigma-70 family RNA polymerase sigma factor [Actinotalea sp. M2MS4P-6]|uniref:sigma-70 family RNA polymerase sigma factor n=1 Tax=Actinotalea sp. M2MS4P-6 TaxID=2983762 RepID=UPI0021E3F88A|nr:sigma-70 family RNA polymerase sigma factor [Actinotalea sp. M2MS4P-6]MCV2392798.1 sigma-70 family RNA polymerase sigma factor [Actinotalea sp. M2MS4P-6]